jgi:hypothetical protein
MRTLRTQHRAGAAQQRIAGPSGAQGGGQLTGVLLQGGLQGGQDGAHQRLEPLPQRVRHLLRPAVLAGPLPHRC